MGSLSAVCRKDLFRPAADFIRAVAPGVALCGIVGLAALGLASVEHRLFRVAWLDPVVLAILLGAGARTFLTSDIRFEAGIRVCGKTVLEVVVVLLGASTSAATVSALGAPLLLGIVATVGAAIVLGVVVGTLLGLPPRMAVLVACGNAICGNSAIAAVAPVIGADSKDVTAAIACTAVLGVVVVLLLPVLGGLLALDQVKYGVFAGLTVYAVPQVLAAAAPIGPVAVQIGTVVKLARVLMLGPVILVLSQICPGGKRSAGVRSLLPWFIIGFIVMICARSLGVIPTPVLPILTTTTGALTVLSMAGLGLQTEARTVMLASGRVIGSVILSLVGLAGLAFALVNLAE